MSILNAVILGIIQGISEFLPISSTAHLTIAGHLMGLISPDHPEAWTAFIAIMQLGTAAAVVIYFFSDLWGIGRALLIDLGTSGKDGQRRWSASSRLFGQIVLGTLPVVVLGLLFKKQIEGHLTKELTVIGSSLILLALLLLWAELKGKRQRTAEQLTWKDGLIVGFGQACALIPGSSRSGTTITAGLFLGQTRETAARFSFLLSIPAVVASGFFELYEVRHMLHAADLAPLVVSTLVAGITGYASIAFLLRYLRSHSTYLFIWYRIVLGALLWMAVLTHFI